MFNSNPFIWREIKEIRNKIVYILIQILGAAFLCIGVGMGIKYIMYYGCALVFFTKLSGRFERELRGYIEITLTFPYSISKIIKIKTAGCLITTILSMLIITVIGLFFKPIGDVRLGAVILELLKYIIFAASLYCFGLIVASCIWLSGRNGFLSNLFKIVFYILMTLFDTFKIEFISYSLAVLIGIGTIAVLIDRFSNEKLIINGGR